MNVPFRLRLLVVGAAALTALAVVPGPASAAPAGGARSPFATQALQAGLTSAQAAQLQARVDADLASGGTQVAANEIRMAGGADLLLALPGESTARHLGGGVVPNFAGGCPSQEFCAFDGPNFSGDVVIAFFCGRNAPVPFTGTNGRGATTRPPGRWPRSRAPTGPSWATRVPLPARSRPESTGCRCSTSFPADQR